MAYIRRNTAYIRYKALYGVFKVYKALYGVYKA
jgi:hypothetical protein